MDLRDDGAGAPAGFPSVVVGSMPLDDSQDAKPAEDADEEIALLAGHASAYVATAGVDDPPIGTSAACWLGTSSWRPAPPRRSRCSSPRRSATRRPASFTVDPETSTRRAHPPDGRRAADDRRRRRPLGPEHRGRARRRACPSRSWRAWRSTGSRGRSRSAGRIPLFVTASDPSPRRFLVSPRTRRAAPAGAYTARPPAADRPVPVLPRRCATASSRPTWRSRPSDPRIARFVAVRRGGADGPTPSRGRPRRLRARHRRSARLLLPARGRARSTSP